MICPRDKLLNRAPKCAHQSTMADSYPQFTIGKRWFLRTDQTDVIAAPISVAEGEKGRCPQRGTRHPDGIAHACCSVTAMPEVGPLSDVRHEGRKIIVTFQWHFFTGKVTRNEMPSIELHAHCRTVKCLEDHVFLYGLGKVRMRHHTAKKFMFRQAQGPCRSFAW